MTPLRYLIAGLIACLIQGYALSFSPQDKVRDVSLNQGQSGMQIQLLASTASTAPAPEEVVKPIKEIVPKKAERPEVNKLAEKSQTTKKLNVAKPSPSKKSNLAKPVTANKPAPKVRENKPQRVAQTPPQARETKAIPQEQPKPQPTAEPEKQQDEKTTPQPANLTSRNQTSQPMLVDKPRFSAKPTPVEYPRLARKKGLEGRALIEVWLDENGKQVKQKIIQSSGHEILDRRALNTIKQWQFSRRIAQGKAIAHRVQIPINFQLK